MRRNKTQPLKEAIDQYLKALKIDKKLKEHGLINHWEGLMGKTVAKSTEKIFIKDGKLFVFLNSSVIRNELFMLRQGIKDALNERAGEKIITEIIFK